MTREDVARNGTSLTYATMLGGVLALRDALIPSLGDAISGPGGHQYIQHTGNYVPLAAKARSLTRATREQRGVPPPPPRPARV